MPDHHSEQKTDQTSRISPSLRTWIEQEAKRLGSRLTGMSDSRRLVTRAQLEQFGLAVAERVQQEQGWQPIASAPKDGTEILLTDGRTYKRVGHWARLRECWSIDVLPPVKPPTHWVAIPVGEGGVTPR